MSAHPPAFAASVVGLLEQAVRARVAPGAALEVGRAAGSVWRTAAGRLTYEEDADPTTIETIFDLASLTKVIATTSLAMRLVESGRLDLHERVGARISRWQRGDRASVTIADLLAHSSGLPAVLPLYARCSGRDDFERAICATPLEYMPRSRSIYSDLGFILLGFVLEDVGGAPLDEQFAAIADLLGDAGDERLSFRPLRGDPRAPLQHADAAGVARTAPTQFDAWRARQLRGEVDDRNGAALGGVAGHTGLFGSVVSAGFFARAVLASRMGRESIPASASVVRRFASRTAVPGSSRALGWDTMLATSSCGTRMSAEAFGHTGFTGTSMWIDPAADVYVVLLTNRVYPAAGSAEGITALRRAVHDAVMEGLG